MTSDFPPSSWGTRDASASKHHHNIAEAAGHILASACVELDALCARFSTHSKDGDGYHSLATLLVELDAFKTRYSKFLVPIEPRVLAPHQASRNAIENDNTQTQYGSPTGLGLAQESAIGGLRLGEQNLVETSTNHGNEAFHSMEAVSKQSPGLNFCQEGSAVSVGVNGLCSQQQNSLLPTQDDGFKYVASSSTDDVNSMLQTGNLGNLDVAWDSMLGFGSYNTQELEALGAPAPQQEANGPFTATLHSAATATPSTGTAQSSIRHACSGCMKTFVRKADGDRHARSHNPNSLRFSCPFPLCTRDFPRNDKLMEHRRRMRH